MDDENKFRHWREYIYLLDTILFETMIMKILKAGSRCVTSCLIMDPK
jgi:hypothetical protein